jgi:hypothetical protein
MFLIPHVASAQVIISEIMYDVPGSDAKAEWIELQNIGTEAVDISKWKINDGSNHVLNAPPKNGSTGSPVIPPGGFLVIASNAENFTGSHAAVSVSVIDSTFSFPNAGGIVSISNASTAVDTVSYTSSRGGNGTGESLQRVDGAWVAAKPTPGFTNTTTKLPKPVVVAPAKKTTPKKKAAASNSEKAIVPEESPIVEVNDSPDSPQVAAAVVPIGEGGSSYMSWAYGALALGVAGASAVIVTRQKKKGEWDIEEIA